MVYLSGLVDPGDLRQMSDRDIDILTGLIEGEIAKNPDVQKILREKIDAYMPATEVKKRR